MTALRILQAAFGVVLTLVGALLALVGLAGCLYHMGPLSYLRAEVMGLHELLDQVMGDPTWRKFLVWLGVHMAGLILVALGRTVVRSAMVARGALEPAEGATLCRRWTEAFCVGLIMIGLTYVNLVKNVETWTKFKAMPEVMYGLHSYWWFSIGYLLALVVFVILAVVHLRRPLAVIPERWLGKGQMLYLAFLWVMVIGNLMRAIPPFHQQRLITEGVIIANAVLCTMLILLLARQPRLAPETSASRYGGLMARTVGIGLFALLVSLAAQTGVARVLYGGQPPPGAGYHARFGPNATAKGKPKPGQPHP